MSLKECIAAIRAERRARMSQPKCPRTFKVYPDNGFVFCTVHVHDTEEQMQKACGGRKVRGPAAFETGHGWDRKGAFTGEIGRVHILLVDGGTDAGFVFHEAVHAAHHYVRFRRRCKVPCDPAGYSKAEAVEETIAQVAEELSRQIFWTFRHRKKVRRQRTATAFTQLTRAHCERAVKAIKPCSGHSN